MSEPAGEPGPVLGGRVTELHVARTGARPLGVERGWLDEAERARRWSVIVVR
ncbi:MAG: hypothetical protein KDK91_17170 [Gammaproteobacteria bacterium]|nr:hypothetical protein [Gammaproteobacteria bacterium]